MQDETACNYNAEANQDDDSCGETVGLMRRRGRTAINDMIVEGCGCVGEAIVEGAQTRLLAIQHEANQDDDSCGETVGSSCDDEDETTINDMIVEGCGCVGEQLLRLHRRDCLQLQC